MAWWQQVVGFWTCELNLEPTPGNYPQKGFLIGEGSVAPDNVFHWSDRASGIEDEAFDGYSTDSKVWWESQAGSTGAAMVLRSSDGRTFEGVSPPGSEEHPGRYREFYSIRADGTFNEVDKKLIGGSWRLYSESSCKRVTGPHHNILSYSWWHRSDGLPPTMSTAKEWVWLAPTLATALCGNRPVDATAPPVGGGRRS